MNGVDMAQLAEILRNKYRHLTIYYSPNYGSINIYYINKSFHNWVMTISEQAIHQHDDAIKITPADPNYLQIIDKILGKHPRILNSDAEF